MLVALLLHGYRGGVCSSRRIARACEERLDFQAVTALNQPDCRNINEFRRRHLNANASKHKAMSYVRMVQAEAELVRKVAEWLARAQAEDAEHASTRRGDEPPGWMRDKQARLARIRAAKAELEAETQQAQAARPSAKTPTRATKTHSAA